MRKNDPAPVAVEFSLFKSGARVDAPTIAIGDTKIKIDGGAQNNVTNLPVGDGAGAMSWLPTQAETNGDIVTVLLKDAVVAGNDWEPQTWYFDTRTETAVWLYLDAAISSRGTADPGDAMALTVGERTTLAGVIWTNAVRTLTSFGTLVADIGAILCSVWSCATRTLTSSSTAPGTGLTARVWTVYRGDTLTRTFSTIAADATITKVQLSVKDDAVNDADTAARLLVDSAVGLRYLNGATPAGAYTGTFTIVGALAITAATMSQLVPGRYDYDVQVWRGAAVQTIEAGTFVVSADSSRSTTP